MVTLPIAAMLGAEASIPYSHIPILPLGKGYWVERGTVQVNSVAKNAISHETVGTCDGQTHDPWSMMSLTPYQMSHMKSQINLDPQKTRMQSQLIDWNVLKCSVNRLKETTTKKSL